MRPQWQRYLWVTLIWTPLLSLILPALLGGRFNLRFSIISLLIGEIVGTCIMGGREILRRLRRSWLARKGFPLTEEKPLVRYVMSGLLMPPSVWLALTIVQSGSSFFGVDWPFIGWSDWWMNFVIGIFCLLVFSAFAIYRDMQEMRQTLEKRHLEARLALITSRLNPHFLFNSLNSLAALIGTEAHRAEQFTIQLSDYYRQVLGALEQERLPLSEELRLSKAYLDIEGIRFGSRLQSRWPDASSAWGRIEVPALCLQPLIENALKHGILPSEEGGRIEIRVDVEPGQLRIQVLDDGEGLGSSSQPGSGTALKNLRERLTLFYGGKAQLDIQKREPRGVAAIVTLPLTELA